MNYQNENKISGVESSALSMESWSMSIYVEYWVNCGPASIGRGWGPPVDFL